MNPRPDPNSMALPELYRELSATGLVRRLLELARDEDLGTPPAAAADITSACIRDPLDHVTAKIKARAPLTLAGLAAVPEMIDVFGGRIDFTPFARDADHVPAGAVLGELRGPRNAVLTLERTLLNLVSRLSGVATITRAFAERIRAQAPASRAALYDTRKTTPGLRVLEKYAVRCGGGRCHRLGLYDAMLIKDNHVAGLSPTEFARAVADATHRARRADPPPRFIEAEVDTLDQLAQLLMLPPGTIDIVLLDNMDIPTLTRAVRLRDESRRPIELEASGGVRLDTIGDIASTGVERISTGAITHHAVSVDVALDIE